MRIDSHQHFWKLSRGDYNWLSPELGAIYRDFLPQDLDPHRKAAGIDKVIIVQAADTIAETEFMLELAGQTDWVAGVVGWVDMEHKDAAGTLAQLAKNPLFKGIRPMIQDIGDDDWILRPKLDHAFEALIDLNLSFDALVLPQHLTQLQRRLDKHPDLRCVINHAAKPKIASGNLGDWALNMERLAKTTNAYCKFSGLLTEAGNTPNQAAIAPAATHVLDVFAPSRVMFGSDWPVLNLVSNYKAWIDIATALTSDLNMVENDRIFGLTAATFYLD